MSKSHTTLLHVTLLVFLAACGQEGGDCVIEETGYLEPCALDDERISWTSLELHAQSVGLDDAAPADTMLELRNLTTGATMQRTSSVSGSFLLELEASPGDQLQLSAVDRPEAGDLTWDVLDQEPFPDYVALTALPDSSSDLARVVVEVLFDAPRVGGHVWAANRANDSTSSLDVFQDGALHAGHVAGQAGDTLLLFWSEPDGAHSAAIEVDVSTAGD